MTAIKKNVCSVFIHIAMGHTTEESRSWVTAAFYVRKPTSIYSSFYLLVCAFSEKKMIKRFTSRPLPLDPLHEQGMRKLNKLANENN